MIEKSMMAHLEIQQARAITVVSPKGSNTMMAYWCMPVSWSPPRIAVAIGKQRHTHTLIEVGAELSVGIIDKSSYEEAVQIFGKQSGRDATKPYAELYFESKYSGLIDSIDDVGDHSLVIMTVQSFAQRVHLNEDSTDPTTVLQTCWKP